MAIVKRTRNGRTVYQAYVYDSTTKKKRYVGQRTTLRGPGGAEQLERDAKTAQAKITAGETPPDLLTCQEYADRWLTVKHGRNTKRPSPSTLAYNRQQLKQFLVDFGDRPMQSIRRREALDWAGRYPAHARTVAAMFRDALDDELAQANPFANRGQPSPKGRKNITPLTESEVEELASIAVDVWGEKYGLTCSAWILFLAWTGCRPSEAFRATWDDLDLDGGLFTVRRVKPPYRTDVVVLPPRAVEALRVMPRRDHPDGLVFLSITGKQMNKGGWFYAYDPCRKAFLSVVKRRDPLRYAELTKGGFDHDAYTLRHFCASWMVENGANEFDGAAQLGNTPEVFRETYLHAHEQQVRERNRAVFARAKVVPIRREETA